MSGQQGSPSAALRICHLWIRLLSVLVPAHRRDDWREEWSAELHWRLERDRPDGPDGPGDASTVPSSLQLLRDATGALPDALVLRLHHTRGLDTMLHDLRSAARSLLRHPSFVALAAVTLALGIGATTAIFSVVDAVLLRPLPYDRPEELVHLWEENPQRGWVENQVAPANFLDWKEQSTTFRSMAAYGEWPSKVILGDVTEPRHARAAAASGDFFRVLGVEPLLGSGFSTEQTWRSGETAVLISHSLWQRFLGGHDDVVGTTLTANGRTVTVQGVLPEEFAWHREPVDLWHTFLWDPASRDQVWFRRAHFLRVIARLGPQVTPDQADRELETIAAELEGRYPDTNTDMGAGLTPLHTWVVGDTRLPLLLLLSAVGLVLLIACVNVANLLLARSASRLREIAVRSALGAGRGRLARQLLCESLLIALVAAILGVGLASAGLSTLLALSPDDVPRLDDVTVNGRVLLFAVGTALFTTLLFGLGPALIGSRSGLGVTGAAQRSTGSPQHARLRGGLVVAEVALALLVVLATGLLGRSFWNLYSVDPGFEPRNLVSVEVGLPGAFYPDDGSANAFFDRLTERVGALPAVESATTTAHLPLVKMGWSSDLSVEGRAPASHEVEIRYGEVGPGFFDTLGVDVLEGRELRPADDSEAPLVAVINRTLRDRLFTDGESPLGYRIAASREPTEETPWFTVVGVVEDTRQWSLERPALPQAYLSISQRSEHVRELVVRTAGATAPGDLVAPLQTILGELDPRLPVAHPRALADVVSSSFARERFVLVQLIAFGGVALLLAAVGIYGVLAYAVQQRRAEIGLRMAIGASDRGVLLLFLRQGMALVAAGAVLGVLAAIGFTRTLEAMLYEVDPMDPSALAFTVVLLSVVGLAACTLPARRAAAVDPATSLNTE